MSMPELQLDPVEARVLASLVEKSLTTPAYYPMTVNGLGNACNQKTARHPLMSLSEGEIGAALNRLEERRLVARDESSARALKWRHRFQHELLLKPAPFAVLVALMLRGTQTAAELRANAAGLNGPADAEGLQKALDDLSDRAQPLVVQLPRAGGQSAVRYAHTLCGIPAVAEPASEMASSLAMRPVADAPDRYAALLARIESLEVRVAELEAALR